VLRTSRASSHHGSPLNVRRKVNLPKFLVVLFSELRLAEFLRFCIEACSYILSLPLAFVGLIFTLSGNTAGSQNFLQASGCLLLAICAVHVFPVSLMESRKRVVAYALISIVIALCFGFSYYAAEIGDPFRSEGSFFSDQPFRLALILCVLPLLRALIRYITVQDSLAVRHR
jgi:hypothetical protein